MIFIDRRDAGRQLAGQLADQSAQPATAVFGLPRGGLVIADEIATAYHLPLEAVICRKLPAPGNPEYAIGAIAENADPVLNEAALVYYGIEGEYVDHVVEEAHTLIKQSILRWRSGHFLPELRSIRAILVDDGAATGLTMLAAIGLLRSLQVQE
ncbi:MAG TPA: phosphoribosyltransferase family protein, partial [bacterium]|nr:phosphoribosyltransferase family protein [bacterium]